MITETTYDEDVRDAVYARLGDGYPERDAVAATIAAEFAIPIPGDVPLRMLCRGDASRGRRREWLLWHSVIGAGAAVPDVLDAAVLAGARTAIAKQFT